MIILIGGEKGGSGKSCLAQNLAVFLQGKGCDVMLLDTDPQGTSADWADERNENGSVKPISCVHASGNIRQTLLDLNSRYGHVIVDAGGQDSEALRSAMTVASKMLLPFRPKRRDLKTLVKMENLVKLATAVNPDLIVNSVITQCPALPSQVQRILTAKDACESFGIKPLNAVTMARNVYDDADEGGLSVLEMHETDPKAAEEVRALVCEFMGFEGENNE